MRRTRSEKASQRSQQKPKQLEEKLKILDAELKNRRFLLTDNMTIADVSVNDVYSRNSRPHLQHGMDQLPEHQAFDRLEDEPDQWIGVQNVSCAVK